MEKWECANCVVKAAGGKLIMEYPDGRIEEAEDTPENRKTLDESLMPVFVEKNKSDSGGKARMDNITKPLVKYGSSLVIVFTKEAAVMGLSKGDEVIISVRKK